jgi:hypothetical protein
MSRESLWGLCTTTVYVKRDTVGTCMTTVYVKRDTVGTCTATVYVRRDTVGTMYDNSFCREGHCWDSTTTVHGKRDAVGTPNYKRSTVISDFRLNVGEICALLGYYAASCANCGTFVLGPSTHEGGSDTLSRHVG